MKSKLVWAAFRIVSLLMIVAMASCKRQQCPAYGKTAPKTVVEKKHA